VCLGSQPFFLCLAAEQAEPSTSIHKLAASILGCWLTHPPGNVAGDPCQTMLRACVLKTLRSLHRLCQSDRATRCPASMFAPEPLVCTGLLGVIAKALSFSIHRPEENAITVALLELLKSCFDCNPASASDPPLIQMDNVVYSERIGSAALGDVATAILPLLSRTVVLCEDPVSSPDTSRSDSLLWLSNGMFVAFHCIHVRSRI